MAAGFSRPVTMIDTTDLYTLLVNVLESTHASECHGALTGLACGRQPGGNTQWSSVLSVPESDKATEILWALGEETTRELNDEGIHFAPVLPDDDEAIETRAGALRLWCRGFLYGFGLGVGQGKAPALADEVSEVLEDFSNIARDELATEDSEEDEAAYMEIVEYLRVSVQLVFETLQPAQQQPTPTLH